VDIASCREQELPPKRACKNRAGDPRMDPNPQPVHIILHMLMYFSSTRKPYSDQKARPSLIERLVNHWIMDRGATPKAVAHWSEV
jgi:hypothetical protein